mmetsp:Transcript_25788/g.61916  ORF Transcript_25788/g.61916 Transcript_25788/m.61916 type:complete len:99 (-) Transcript_25788:1553-1849(-)
MSSLAVAYMLHFRNLFEPGGHNPTSMKDFNIMSTVEEKKNESRRYGIRMAEDPMGIARVAPSRCYIHFETERTCYESYEDTHHPIAETLRSTRHRSCL